MWILIDPNDVLMFRGNKPFAAGQSFVASSTFPPHPQVMQGVIRTAIMEAQNVNFSRYKNGAYPELEAQIGNATSLGQLRLCGPFVCRFKDDKTPERLFALPQDVRIKKITGQISTLQPSRELETQMRTNVPFKGWLPSVLPTQNSETQDANVKFDNTANWITESGLQQYLHADAIDQASIVPEKSLFQKESHLGIGMDYRRRAADEVNSLVYRAEFTRVHDAPPSKHDEVTQRIGLFVNIELNEENKDTDLLPHQGYLTLGGESRFAAYKKVSFENHLPEDNQQLAGRIKLVLLTPAFFSAGWQPAEPQNGNRWAKWLGEKAKLISIAAGEPLTISGWDIANNRPKPLYRYMPAGSVYYFEDAQAPTQPFTETPPSGPDAGAMGFGEVAIGTWNYLD